jgi:hypothetical protein
MSSSAADQGTGKTYGVLGRVELLSYLFVQPNISFGKFGKVSFDFGSRKGSNVEAYNLEFLFGWSTNDSRTFWIYGIIGQGYHKVSRKYDDDRIISEAIFGICLEYRMVNRFAIEIGLRTISYDRHQLNNFLTAGINCFL